MSLPCSFQQTGKRVVMSATKYICAPSTSWQSALELCTFLRNQGKHVTPEAAFCAYSRYLSLPPAIGPHQFPAVQEVSESDAGEVPRHSVDECESHVVLMKLVGGQPELAELEHRLRRYTASPSSMAAANRNSHHRTHNLEAWEVLSAAFASYTRNPSKLSEAFRTIENCNLYGLTPLYAGELKRAARSCGGGERNQSPSPVLVPLTLLHQLMVNLTEAWQRLQQPQKSQMTVVSLINSLDAHISEKRSHTILASGGTGSPLTDERGLQNENTGQTDEGDPQWGGVDAISSVLAEREELQHRTLNVVRFWLVVRNITMNTRQLSKSFLKDERRTFDTLVKTSSIAASYLFCRTLWGLIEHNGNGLLAIQGDEEGEEGLSVAHQSLESNSPSWHIARTAIAPSTMQLLAERIVRCSPTWQVADGFCEQLPARWRTVEITRALMDRVPPYTVSDMPWISHTLRGSIPHSHTARNAAVKCVTSWEREDAAPLFNSTLQTCVFRLPLPWSAVCTLATQYVQQLDVDEAICLLVCQTMLLLKSSGGMCAGSQNDVDPSGSAGKEQNSISQAIWTALQSLSEGQVRVRFLSALLLSVILDDYPTCYDFMADVLNIADGTNSFVSSSSTLISTAPNEMHKNDNHETSGEGEEGVASVEDISPVKRVILQWQLILAGLTANASLTSYTSNELTHTDIGGCCNGGELLQEAIRLFLHDDASQSEVMKLATTTTTKLLRHRTEEKKADSDFPGLFLASFLLRRLYDLRGIGNGQDDGCLGLLAAPVLPRVFMQCVAHEERLGLGSLSALQADADVGEASDSKPKATHELVLDRLAGLAVLPIALFDETELVCLLFWAMRTMTYAENDVHREEAPRHRLRAAMPLSREGTGVGFGISTSPLVSIGVRCVTRNVAASLLPRCLEDSIIPPLLLNWVVAQGRVTWPQGVRLLTEWATDQDSTRKAPFLFLTLPVSSELAKVPCNFPKALGSLRNAANYAYYRYSTVKSKLSCTVDAARPFIADDGFLATKLRVSSSTSGAAMDRMQYGEALHSEDHTAMDAMTIISQLSSDVKETALQRWHREALLAVLLHYRNSKNTPSMTVLDAKTADGEFYSLIEEGALHILIDADWRSASATTTGETKLATPAQYTQKETDMSAAEFGCDSQRRIPWNLQPLDEELIAAYIYFVRMGCNQTNDEERLAVLVHPTRGTAESTSLPPPTPPPSAETEQGEQEKVPTASRAIDLIKCEYVKRNASTQHFNPKVLDSLMALTLLHSDSHSNPQNNNNNNSNSRHCQQETYAYTEESENEEIIAGIPVFRQNSAPRTNSASFPSPFPSRFPSPSSRTVSQPIEALCTNIIRSIVGGEHGGGLRMKQNKNLKKEKQKQKRKSELKKHKIEQE